MERIVIIGAGQAGVQAAASLRAAGYAGALAMVGDEPFPALSAPAAVQSLSLGRLWSASGCS